MPSRRRRIGGAWYGPHSRIAAARTLFRSTRTHGRLIEDWKVSKISTKMREAKHLLEVYNIFCTTHVEWDGAIDAAMAADPPAAEKG